MPLCVGSLRKLRSRFNPLQERADLRRGPLALTTSCEPLPQPYHRNGMPLAAGGKAEAEEWGTHRA